MKYKTALNIGIDAIQHLIKEIENESGSAVVEHRAVELITFKVAKDVLKEMRDEIDWSGIETEDAN